MHEEHATSRRKPPAERFGNGVQMSMDLFDTYARAYEARRETEMSVAEYLEGCRADPMMYAGAPSGCCAAIGEPEMVDTARTRGSAASS